MSLPDSGPIPVAPGTKPGDGIEALWYITGPDGNYPWRPDGSRDLSWRYLADTEAALAALSHAPTTTTLPIIDNVEWGRNAAHQAYITLQRPVRIAIHARDMIPT